jgi:hypothetical protein
MKFGILYNTDYYPNVHGSASSYYGQILEQAQLEEELGFHARTPPRHLRRNSERPGPESRIGC